MSPVQFPLGRLARGCAAALAGLLGLAAGNPARAEEPAPAVPTVDPALAAALAYWPPENSPDLLAVDEPMKLFFAARVDRRSEESERLKQIVTAIVGPEGLNFGYEADGTCDAREAFRRRRGSCVTFAFLVMAVAREYGLNAQFQEFDTLQLWNRFDRFVASVRHTNVRVVTPGMVFVVDLRPDCAPALVSSDQYVVADKRAFAHFYSTAGFFRLVHGDAPGALRLMNRGAECDPRSRIVWANLGNVHAERGELAEARACFEKSLKYDRRGELALVCLVDVLRRQGGPEELKLADKYEQRAQALRLRNPYYHYHLAGQAQAAGDWARAEQHLQQAIKLKADEPVFHELLVQALRQLGRAADAERAEAKLAKLRKGLAGGAGRAPGAGRQG